MSPESHPQFVEVKVDCLQLSPTNPRTQFDPTRQAELTASIQAQGVLVPLLCRPLTATRLPRLGPCRRPRALGRMRSDRVLTPTGD